jgi:hypothetical protein
VLVLLPLLLVYIRYADDFIITAKSRTLLVEHVLPAVKQFLAERGLTLSEEKTKITCIRHGFTFPGQTFRKHGNTLHITPSEEGTLALIRKVGTLIKIEQTTISESGKDAVASPLTVTDFSLDFYQICKRADCDFD